jgi:ketosteroid isomerase-like protein
MDRETKSDDVAAVMRRMNQAWLNGRVDDMAPLVHPDIVMVVPGFAGRVRGREMVLGGFRDFSGNATIHEFREYDHQFDVVGDTAVVGFRYEMVYERSGQRYRATGRDLWVFQQQHNSWLAVWRTMLELGEKPA